MLSLQEKFERHFHRLDELSPISVDGKVKQITGVVIEATGRNGSVGDVCEIFTRSNKTIKAEIVGFKDETILLMPLGETLGVATGSRVKRSAIPLRVPVGDMLLGRVLDGLGNPMDGKGVVPTRQYRTVFNYPPNPLKRKRIDQPLATGIRAIDGLITLGKGQRVGIFAGSGVGKSVLLGMMARYTNAHVNVIALIGERGREVREFIERDLGPEGLKRSVVVVATSDQAATVRIKAALIATTIAEYFRDQGLDVLLLMDSLTRVAMAQREIGLAIGEPPTTKGYTPSVFALMPRLLERAGNSDTGSITGLYTVLVEGGDLDEPVSDTARSILDGHIVLSRKIATRGHFPAIDVLESVSRLRNEVTQPEHQKMIVKLLETMAIYRESEDLINIGAYKKGTNPRLDEAIEKIEAINDFLKQNIDERSTFEQTIERMKAII
ncbi:flagellar protein export ATPase FliI [Caldithrix abyssi DSM 13497]|uniref:Flagellar protein export ATPase FliI n=1 Tax=Caldithrix abyssi DSM 13497 TaxID=880073 RepID=H1XPZ5_CALAY|nr:flagellar protein export ATPase FliI [Caldithrix abyssi]EHO42246.1 flagellar protein export ATPase FliI [Caldithrix abyssi DSM 13497]